MGSAGNHGPSPTSALSPPLTPTALGLSSSHKAHLLQPLDGGLLGIDLQVTHPSPEPPLMLVKGDNIWQ